MVNRNINCNKDTELTDFEQHQVEISTTKQVYFLMGIVTATTLYILLHVFL